MMPRLSKKEKQLKPFPATDGKWLDDNTFELSGQVFKVTPKHDIIKVGKLNEKH